MNEVETQMVHVNDYARMTSSTSDATLDPVSLTGAMCSNASGVSSFHTIEPQEIHDAMLRQDTTLAAERDPAVAEAVANDQDGTALIDSGELRQPDDNRDACMESNEAVNQDQTVIEHDKMDVDAIPPPIDQDQTLSKEVHEAKGTQHTATDQEIHEAPTDQDIHEVPDHKDGDMETSGSKGEVKTERCNEAEASAVIEAAGAAATDGTEFTAKVAGDAPIEATAAVASKFAGDAAIEAAEKAEIKVESGPVDHVERRVEETSVPAGEASEDVKMEDVNVAGHGSNDATDVSNLATEASQGATDGSNDANKDDGTGDVGAASDKDGDTAKDDAEARSANPAMDDDSAANCSSPRATSPRANDASAMSPPRDPAVAALGVETNGDTPPPSKPGAGTPSFSVGTPSVAADTPRQKNISPDSQSSLVDPGLVADENAAPFTISQWQQLEQQALIFKYLVSGAAVPPELIDSLYSTSDSPRQSPDGPASWATPLKDAEPLRCRRTDGKKWRCSREAVTDQKYCERHMHRGRNRLGKSRRLSDKATAGSSLSIQAASSEGPMGCVEGTCSAMTDTCTDTPCHKGLVPKFELGSVSKMEIGSVSKLRLNTDDVGSTVTRGSPPPPLALPPPAQPVGADQARTPASKTSGLGCSKQLAIELSPENTGSPVPTNQQPHDPACTPSATAAPAASASAVTGSDTAAAPPSRAMFTPFGLPEPTPAPSTSSAPPPEAASNSKLLVSGGSDCYNPQQPQQQQQQQQQQQPFEQQQQQQPFEQQQHFGADPRLQKSQSMPCHSSGSSNGRIQLQLNGSLGPRLTSTFQPGHSIVEGDEGSPAPMPPQQPQQQHALMPSRSMPPRQQQSGASNALYSQQQQPAGRMGSPPRMQRSTSLVLGGGQRLCLQVPPSGNSRTPVSSSGMAPAGAAAGADTAGAGGGNGVGQLQPGHYQLQTGGRGPNGAVPLGGSNWQTQGQQRQSPAQQPFQQQPPSQQPQQQWRPQQQQPAQQQWQGQSQQPQDLSSAPSPRPQQQLEQQPQQRWSTPNQQQQPWQPLQQQQQQQQQCQPQQQQQSQAPSQQPQWQPQQPGQQQQWQQQQAPQQAPQQGTNAPSQPAGGNQWQSQPAQAPLGQQQQQQQQWQSPCAAQQQQTPRSQQQGGQWQGQNQQWQPEHAKQAPGQAPMTPVMQPQQQQGMDQAGQPQPQQTPYTPQQGQSRQGAAQRGEACKFSSRALVLSGEPESPETHPLVSARSAYSDGAPKAQQPLQQQQMRVQPVQGQQQPMNVQHQAQPQPQHQPQPQVSVQQAPLQQASVMQPQPMQTTAMSGPPQPMRAPRGSMLPPPPPNVQPPLQQQQPHSQTLPMPLGGLASSSSTTSSTSSGGGVKVPLLRLPSLVQRPPAHPSPLGPPPSSLSSHGSGLSASSMASPIGTPVGTPMGAPHSNPYVLTRCSSVPEPRHGRPHLMRSQSMFESPRKSFVAAPSDQYCPPPLDLLNGSDGCGYSDGPYEQQQYQQQQQQQMYQPVQSQQQQQQQPMGYQMGSSGGSGGMPPSHTNMRQMSNTQQQQRYSPAPSQSRMHSPAPPQAPMGSQPSLSHAPMGQPQQQYSHAAPMQPQQQQPFYQQSTQAVQGPPAQQQPPLHHQTQPMQYQQQQQQQPQQQQYQAQTMHMQPQIQHQQYQQQQQQQQLPGPPPMQQQTTSQPYMQQQLHSTTQIHPPSACADDRQQQQQPPQQQQSGLSIDMFFSDDSPWEEASALIGRSPNLGPLPCVEDADDCGLISGPPSQYFSVNPSDSQDAFLAA